jgi:hypothetical protein
MLKSIKYMLLILVIPASVYSQEIRLLPGETLPDLNSVQVMVNVHYDSTLGTYRYTYVVTNPNTNTGAISDIEVDITKPSGSINLTGDGLVSGQGYLEQSSKKISDRLAASIVPVGISAPKNWVTGVTVRGTASWGAAEDIALIYPGSSTNQFEMNSRGLPGIRDLTISPDFKQQPVEEASQEDLDRIRAIESKIGYKAKTIGPTAPPANFKPIEFLDYIVSLKKDAYYQGWIIQKDDDRDKDRDKDKDRDRDKKDKKNEKDKDKDKETGIMNSLDKKLDKARVELVKGDNREAIEKLKAFTLEVAALYKEGKEIRQSHITSEAFALLYYNTQYLIDQLGGEKKERSDKKEDKDRSDAR